MGIINIKEIEEKLEKMMEIYNALKEKEHRIQDYLDSIQEENERYIEENEPWKMESAENGIEDDLENIWDEMNEISKGIKKLQRFKSIKAEGDEYNSLYHRRYSCHINKQTDFQVEDMLARRKEAKTIAGKLKVGEIKTAGIFGEWGTGKSTLLGYVEDELKERSIETVKIDASEYSDQEKIWAYIYSKISEKFNTKIRRRCKFFLSRIKKNWGVVLINILISICIIIFVVYPTTRGMIVYFIENNDNKLISTCADYAISLAFIYLYIIYVLPKIVEINSGFKHINHWFRNNMFTPCQNDVLGYKVEIKNNLDNMLNSWGKPIVLLIDELDRCSEDVLVNFFDTMQLFQHSENIQIVYAVDRRSVDRALEHKKIPREEIDNYLKKYIDYGINLYSINKETQLLMNIIKQHNFTEKEFTTIYSFIHQDLQINITIRDLKEILNILCEIKNDWLNKYIFTKEYEEDSNYVVSFISLIPWAIDALAGTKWIAYIFEDFPLLTESQRESYGENTIEDNINTDELKNKYANCPKYLKQTQIIDIVCYKELISKYKMV